MPLDSKNVFTYYVGLFGKFSPQFSPQSTVMLTVMALAVGSSAAAPVAGLFMGTKKLAGDMHASYVNICSPNIGA